MPEPSFVQRLLRERALSRYLSALERGDIDTVISVLDQSAKDGVLEQMIFDLHETYQTEEEFLEMVQAVQDEPDVLEIENGVFKSRLEGKLPDLKRVGRGKYRVLARSFQWLVAALLVVCVLAGFLNYAQFQANQPSGGAGLPIFTASCVTTGASTSAYSGVPVFSQVSVVTPRDSWVVGNVYASSASFLSVQPMLEHWDGAHWTIAAGLNIMGLLKTNSHWNGAALQRLAVVSASDIWAVGSVGTYAHDSSSSYQPESGQVLIEHWNGRQWQAIPAASGVSDPYSVLNDVAAISPNNVWAVGYTSDAARIRTAALLEHWDGSHWTRITPGALTSQVGVLDSIRATSARDIWVFGRSSPLLQSFPLAAHWDGQNWSVTSLSAATGLNQVKSVTALSASDIWVAGSGSQISSAPAPALVIHWNGQNWQAVAGTKELGAGTTLLGIAAAKANDIWAAGSAADKRSLIVHWNGQRWKAVPHPSPSFAYLSDITINNGKVWTIGGTYRNNAAQTATGTLIETSC